MFTEQCSTKKRERQEFEEYSSGVVEHNNKRRRYDQFHQICPESGRKITAPSSSAITSLSNPAAPITIRLASTSEDKPIRTFTSSDIVIKESSNIGSLSLSHKNYTTENFGAIKIEDDSHLTNTCEPLYQSHDLEMIEASCYQPNELYQKHTSSSSSCWNQTPVITTAPCAWVNKNSIVTHGPVNDSTSNPIIPGEVKLHFGPSNSVGKSDSSPNSILGRIKGMQMESGKFSQYSTSNIMNVEKGIDRTKHSFCLPTTDSSRELIATPKKKSFSMGFRADCEKCRQKVPGHFNHIVTER